MNGKSLKRILLDDRDPGKEAVYSETQGLRTVRTRKWKYGEKERGKERELYDLESDGLEGHNLVAEKQYADVANEMKRKLDEWEQATPPVVPRDLSTVSPYDPDYPRHEGWLILSGQWWPEKERI